MRTLAQVRFRWLGDGLVQLQSKDFISSRLASKTERTAAGVRGEDCKSKTVRGTIFVDSEAHSTARRTPPHLRLRRCARAAAAKNSAKHVAEADFRSGAFSVAWRWTVQLQSKDFISSRLASKTERFAGTVTASYATKVLSGLAKAR